jgi:fructosamine-3-kinase
MSDAAALACVESGLGEVTAGEDLLGGIICRTRRLRLSSGISVVAKQIATPLPGFFAGEAEGLRTIDGVGWTVPRVLAARPGLLILEDLGNRQAPAKDYWERLARAWARLHGRRASRFGWERDLHYGLLRQDNRWREDGWSFYAETRFLPWLEQPGCATLLDARDRRNLEMIADRLRDLVPAQGPSLLHGDLWSGNLLIDPRGGPAVIDPSVHYGWPEADLHNAWIFGAWPQAFWDAYRESHYLEPGWRERLDLLSLPHLLGMIAHACDLAEVVPWTKRLLARFA